MSHRLWADVDDMNNPIRSIRRAAVVALAVAAVPVLASPASAATSGRWHQGKRATTTTAAATPAPAATTASAPVTSVISIGGYVFYNLTYLEAVEAWQAAVAAAPAGYTPPTVYSVSVSTTVSGTV